MFWPITLVIYFFFFFFFFHFSLHCIHFRTGKYKTHLTVSRLISLDLHSLQKYMKPVAVFAGARFQNGAKIMKFNSQYLEVTCLMLKIRV